MDSGAGVAEGVSPAVMPVETNADSARRMQADREASESRKEQDLAASMQRQREQEAKDALQQGSPVAEGIAAEAVLRETADIRPTSEGSINRQGGSAPADGKPENPAGSNSHDAVWLQDVNDTFATQSSPDTLRAVASGNGGQPPEAPIAVGTQPGGEQNPQNQATDAQVEAALDAAARQQVADRRQRIDEFKSWTPDQVAEEIAVYERRLNMANEMMQKGSPPETQRLGQEQFRKAQDRLDELRSAQRDAHARERPTGGEADVDRARREVQARLDFNQKLSEMTVGQLNTQSQLEQGNLTDLESMLNGPLTRAERDAINEKIRDTKARIDTVDKYKSLKEPAEKEQQTKSEAEAQKAEEAKEHEELIKTRAETASTEDIKDFEENISSINGEISDFEKQFAELDRQIAAEADKDAKAELTQRRKELRKNIIEARTRLKTYESALKTATERQRGEAGPDVAIDTETLQPMTNAQYEKLTPEQKQARLQELARALPSLTPELYKELQDKIKNGENFSQNELGQFVGYARDRLMAGDKKMLKDVYALNGKYPEVAASIIAAINATEEGNKLLGEMVHGKLEKIMKSKGLLMMLLALIASIIATGVQVGVKTAFGEKK